MNSLTTGMEKEVTTNPRRQLKVVFFFHWQITDLGYIIYMETNRDIIDNNREYLENSISDIIKDTMLKEYTIARIIPEENGVIYSVKPNGIEETSKKILDFLDSTKADTSYLETESFYNRKIEVLKNRIKVLQSAIKELIEQSTED